MCGRIGPLVHWYLCVVAVRAGGRARTWPVRSGRARESRGPVRFTRARGASPDSAAAAQGHFCHTLSVRRWPGASPQRGDRLVVRPAAPASRKHPVVIGAGCAARERRWKGPMPSFSALSAWHSRRRGRRRVEYSRHLGTADDHNLACGLRWSLATRASHSSSGRSSTTLPNTTRRVGANGHEARGV